ncbi:FecR family protein [Sphingomonas oryzagri]
MSSNDMDDRRERLYEEADKWVSRILRNRKRHAAGLRKWVGTSDERADIYNEAYRNQAKARALGAPAFGNARQRQANRIVAEIRTIPYRRIIGITAALMLVGAACAFGISALVNLFSPPPAASGQLSEIATKVGEVRTVTLPDGSRALLDTQTAIRVSFTGSERRIEMLRGRARFAVVHNPARPFIVTAQGVSVTAKGTVFDVDMNHGVEVHLIKGSVDVDQQNRRSTTKPIHLATGEHVVIDPASSRPPAPPAQARPSDAQWVTGFVPFDDVPADVVIDQANRYSNTKIELANPADGVRPVFLDLHIRDTRKVAHDLATFLNLNVDESHPGKIILGNRK